MVRRHTSLGIAVTLLLVLFVTPSVLVLLTSEWRRDQLDVRSTLFFYAPTQSTLLATAPTATTTNTKAAKHAVVTSTTRNDDYTPHRLYHATQVLVKALYRYLCVQWRKRITPRHTSASTSLPREQQQQVSGAAFDTWHHANNADANSNDPDVACVPLAHDPHVCAISM